LEALQWSPSKCALLWHAGFGKLVIVSWLLQVLSVFPSAFTSSLFYAQCFCGVQLGAEQLDNAVLSVLMFLLLELDW